MIKLRKFITHGLLVLVTAGATAVAVEATGHADTPTPVYVCSSFDTCQDGQFLKVSDHNDAPIFAVGATGGPKTFGDNMGVYGPTDIYNPSLVMSYTDPATYNRTFNLPNTCKAPALWVAPQGIYTCNYYGRWVRHSF